ncbi:MAG: DUF6689 family protein [Arenimonas sp.]|jgi:hypothetical protein
MTIAARSFFAPMLLLLSAWSSVAAAQSLPVSVNVSGNIATVIIGAENNPIADVTLSFDDANGLSAASLGVSAQMVSISDPALLSRLSGGALTAMSSSFPVMITIEPPALGGLSQHRVTHIEVHTHALPYIAGSPLRLFKAQLNGPFRDITDGVLPGSVRTRGSTPGWSQFIIVTDLRGTSGVIAEKFAYLRTQLAALPIGERTPLSNYLDQAEDAVADGRYSDAAAALDSFTARVSSRSGTFIPDLWRATRDTQNIAGELLAGASTLGFSIGFLRDFGI